MTNLEKLEQKLTNIFNEEYLDKILTHNEDDVVDPSFWLGVDYALIHIRHAIEKEREENGIN